MTYVLGLTGSIGMGKSTTAQLFSDEGVPVWDADASVRSFYEPGRPAVKIIATKYPSVMDGNAVSREKLRALIAQDESVLDHLQEIVHPLVAKDRASFLKKATAPVVLLDVPLLFETNLDESCDGVVVVTAPFEVQKKRVLDRGEMTETDFEFILSRQMSDIEKRAKATWVIETLTLDAARQSVKDILKDIQTGRPHA